MADTFPVDGIIETLGTKMGLNVGTDGIDDACYGIVINAQKTFTQFLGQHKDIYNFLVLDDIVDGVPMIRVIRRAVNSDIEVDFEVAENDCIVRSLDAPAIKYVRTDPISLPRSVELQYISFDRSFSINTQYARNEAARVQQGVLSVRSDFILSDQAARDLAYDLLFRLWARQLTLSFEHPDITIEPSDIVQIATRQGTYTVQILTSMITKEPNGTSGPGRTNQLIGQLLLTNKGVITTPGSVNNNSSVGFFHIAARTTVAAIGAFEELITGSASGLGTLLAVGRSNAAAAGSMAGVGSASAIGESLAAGVGAAAGTGSVDAVALGGSVLAAEGTSDLIAIGASLDAGVGVSAGTGDVVAAGASLAISDGSSAGAGSLSGVAFDFTTALESGTAHNVTLSNGNLTATNTTTTSTDQGAHTPSASGRSSGKYYFEATFTTIINGGNYGFGVGTTASTIANMGNNATTGTMIFKSGNIYANGSLASTAMGTRAQGDVIGIAVDLDNLKVWYKKVNGTPGNWNGSGTANPATNTGGITMPSGTMIPFVTFGGTLGVANNVETLNPGATAFTGAVPSGFIAGWPT